MSWSGHHTIDPSELEARFAIEDGMSYMNSIFTEPTDEDLELIETVKGILEALPGREADFVELYYFKRMKQTDIAYVFDVSQPTVCYRLKRATARIQFLLQLPEVEEEALLRDMTAFLPDPLDVQIMHQMWLTTCQSEVAGRLGVSQGLVRHRFLRTIKRMQGFYGASFFEEGLEELLREKGEAVTPYEKFQIMGKMKSLKESLMTVLKWVPEPLRSDPSRRQDYDIYIRLFQFIAANLNILREVQRPVWETPVQRRID